MRRPKWSPCIRSTTATAFQADSLVKLPPLVPARLIRRYKRFLADVEFADGRGAVAHCANPGSMLGLAVPGARIWLQDRSGGGRKLDWSWKLVETRDHGLVGIDTSIPNALVEEAILGGAIPELAGYGSLRREVAYGRNSRIDILLEGEGRPRCLVEVKNVHLMRLAGLAEFPDSVTARGAKHLDELADSAEAGDRAVMVYLVQMAADRFALARDIDPAYAAAFDRATARGVEAMAFACTVSVGEIAVARRVPITGIG